MLDLAEMFTEEDIYFELYRHRAIYTNEDALVVKAEQGFQGTETKSLFLKGKNGRNYIFLTFTTKRANFKQLSQLVGTRLSVVFAEEMEQQTVQKSGAVSPFGYDIDVPLIIDEELLDHEKLVFAPGRPDRTMVVLVKDLKKILSTLNMETLLFSDEVNK